MTLSYHEEQLAKQKAEQEAQAKLIKNLVKGAAAGGNGGEAPTSLDVFTTLGALKELKNRQITE